MTSLENLFHRDWYLSENPDVELFAGDPLEHYKLFGWREGRSPHPLFSTQHYLTLEPECTARGIEPLTHYITVGWRKLRTPHPFFNAAGYLLRNKDLLLADVEPWQHYLFHGWKEGRSLHPLFDNSWYLKVYKDVAETGIDPLSHYIHVGWKEGRVPHPAFEPSWYARTYLGDNDINPWLEYVLTGWKEGRHPHPEFNGTWYHEQYLDPINYVCEPLAHYLTSGWREGLLPRADYTSDLSGNDGAQAPFYLELADVKPPLPSALSNAKHRKKALREDGRRGKLLLVTHDTQLGGAQTVLRLFADWVLSSTRFSVGIVAINGGHFRYEFEKIAPVFVLSDHEEEDRAAALSEWAGEDVKAVFVNSIVSGAFYKYWQADTPSVGFIHELPQILERYPEEVSLVRDRTDHVICGGPDVYAALSGDFGFDAERMASAHSFIEALPKGDTEADRASRRAAARTGLGVPDERILVMGCGVAHWRKSPDKFVETAEKVLAAGLDAEFVWLGGGPDEEACIAQAAAAGISDRVHFTGYEPEVAAKLAGADIFLLSSQEDPFPLVALYAAQAGVPITCFQNAGGIAQFVQTGSGQAVPFMDVDAMAEAVLLYGLDTDRRLQDGETGRTQVARQYTINAVGPMLLHALRKVAGLAPEVSVVLPNYNYEAYLPQRLDSIIAQEFQDFELILLDDASTDGSPQLLSEFAKTRAGTKTALNTENSGSPFAQWMRGMDMAEAEIIWLAEADDWCEDSLLTTLLPLFNDRNVRLASVMSVPVRSDGSIIGDYSELYLNRINPGRWTRDFIATDHEEANEGLGIANTIPNASAVLMRKFEPDADFAERVQKMRLCGDWFFYIRAMKGGLVGFSAEPLNYHRRHENTVTHKLEGSLRYFTELAEVRGYVGRTYRQSPKAIEQVQQFLEQDIGRFKVEDRRALPALDEPKKELPALAVIAPDLSPGGGQMFAISLANDWHRRGGRVLLVNAHSQPTHPAVITKLNPEVALYHANEDGFDLAQLVSRYDIDIIHSSIWWADALVDNYRDSLPDDIPWIISMHGCHETLLKHPGIDRSFPDRMQRMIERAAAFVYTAEKNLAVYETYPKPERLSRIPNGMPQEPIRQHLDRAALGLRSDALVMCLASRAIPSKGWMEAVELTRLLNAEGHIVDLMLIGEGPSADEIRSMSPEHVYLMGQVSNLQDYLAIADVGLLPSYFVGESLPLVLIEMLAKGLPLVASTIGEIASIVGTGEKAAGILVPLEGEGINMAALVEALRQLLDPAEREQFSQNAQERFDEEFRIERMVDRYAELYRMALQRHTVR